jgi:hypothetical protein
MKVLDVEVSPPGQQVFRRRRQDDAVVREGSKSSWLLAFFWRTRPKLALPRR